jgi:hypothetical protein
MFEYLRKLFTQSTAAEVQVKIVLYDWNEIGIDGLNPFNNGSAVIQFIFK